MSTTDMLRATQAASYINTVRSNLVANQDSARSVAEALNQAEVTGKLRQADRSDALTGTIKAAAAERIAETTATSVTISTAARQLEDTLTSGLYGVMASAPLQPAARAAEPIHAQRIRAVSAYQAASRVGVEDDGQRSRA